MKLCGYLSLLLATLGVIALLNVEGKVGEPKRLRGKPPSSDETTRRPGMARRLNATKEGIGKMGNCTNLFKRKPCFSECVVGCKRNLCGLLIENGMKCCPKVQCISADIYFDRECCPKCCSTNKTKCDVKTPMRCQAKRRGGFDIKCDKNKVCKQVKYQETINEMANETGKNCGKPIMNNLDKLSKSIAEFESEKKLTLLKLRVLVIQKRVSGNLLKRLLNPQIRPAPCAVIIKCVIVAFDNTFKLIETASRRSELGNIRTITSRFADSYKMCFQEDQAPECKEEARKTNLIQLAQTIEECRNVANLSSRLDKMPSEVSDFNKNGVAMMPKVFRKIACNEISDPCMAKLLLKMDDVINEKCGGQKREVSGPAYYMRSKECMRSNDMKADDMLRTCPCKCAPASFVAKMNIKKIAEAIKNSKTRKDMAKCDVTTKKAYGAVMKLAPGKMSSREVTDTLAFFKPSDFKKLNQSVCQDMNRNRSMFKSIMKAAVDSGDDTCDMLLRTCTKVMKFAKGDPKFDTVGLCSSGIPTKVLKNMTYDGMKKIARNLAASQFKNKKKMREIMADVKKNYYDVMKSRHEKINSTNVNTTARMIWALKPEDLDEMLNVDVLSNPEAVEVIADSLDKESLSRYHTIQKVKVKVSTFKQLKKQISAVGVRKVRNLMKDAKSGALKIEDITEVAKYIVDYKFGQALMDVANEAKPMDETFTTTDIKPAVHRYATKEDVKNLSQNLVTEMASKLSSVIHSTNPGLIRFLLKKILNTYSGSKNLPRKILDKIGSSCVHLTKEEAKNMTNENMLECLSNLRSMGTKIDKLLPLARCRFWVDMQLKHTDLSASGGSNDSDVSSAAKMEYSHVPDFCACALSKDQVSKASDVATTEKLLTKLEACLPRSERDVALVNLHCELSGDVELEKLKRFAVHLLNATKCKVDNLTMTKVADSLRTVMRSFDKQKDAQTDQVTHGNQGDVTETDKNATETNQIVTAKYLLGVNTTVSSRRKRSARQLTCGTIEPLETGIVAITETDITNMAIAEFTDCLSSFAENVEWSAAQCLALRTRMGEAYSDIGTWDSGILLNIGCLVQCLTTADTAALPYTSVAELISYGRCSRISLKKRRELFNRYMSKMISNNPMMLTAADIMGLGSLTCAASVSQVAAMNAENVLTAINNIGSADGDCPADVANAYVTKLKESSLTSSVTAWPPTYIGNLGKLIDGLSNSDIASLSNAQVSRIAASTIAAMSPIKMAQFTAAQLGTFNDAQKSSVTIAHKLQLSEAQTFALWPAPTGPESEPTGGHTLHASVAMMPIMMVAVLCFITM